MKKINSPLMANIDDKKSIDQHLDRMGAKGVTRREFVSIVSAGAAAVAAGSALGIPSVTLAQETGKLAFLAFTTRIEYIVDAARSMEAAAKALGFSGFTLLDGNFDSTKMLNDAQTVGTDATAAFVFQPPDGSSLRRIAEVAKESKTYFGNVWATLPWYTPHDASEYFGLYAVPDEFTAHRDVTRELCKAMMEKFGGGDVIGITGVPGFSTDIVRSRGRDAALTEFSDCKLVDQLPGFFNREDSLKATQDLLARNPNVRGIVAQNDSVAAGVLAALRGAGLRAGEDVLVVGADGTSEGVNGIADGLMVSTSANSPAFMGAFFTAHLYDMVNGWEPRLAERMLYWRSVTLTADNLTSYKKRYVDNGDIAPFDYRKMSKVLHPDDWDPQNEIFPMDIDHEFKGIEKPANYEYPAGYIEAKTQWEEVTADYAAHYKTPFMGPSPKA